MNRSRIQSVWCPILAVWFSAAATASLARCRFPADATGRVFTYTFDPTVTPAGTVLHVTLKFQGGAEGMDAVEVPSQWAGETLRGVINLRALSGDTAVADTGSPGKEDGPASSQSGGDSRLRHGKGLDRSEEHTSELQSPCNLV